MQLSLIHILVVLFALMGILPGAVIYVVSVQFVSRSIESWFDVRVESALDSGVKLGQAILESSREDLNLQASNLAVELGGLSATDQTLLLSRLDVYKRQVFFPPILPSWATKPATSSRLAPT